ncbi:hypothetical protein, partial [Caulobacter sp. 17J65-9]|uniref:hypothetical protein n=1 Tax=Caulobacter sp. 17J65-9 TaxID=2709382 RepID=UPI0013C8F40E
MAERRSSHIRGRRAPGRTPNHAWRDRVLGCSLALTAVAAASEAAATDVCPHAEFAPNPWFTCLGDSRPAAPVPDSDDEAVVVADDGTVTIDAAGHVVGVFAEAPGGRVTTDGAGEVEIRTGGEGAVGVALVGGPSVAGLGAQTVVAGPVAGPASIWFETPEAAGDRGRLFVFGADGALRLSPKPPVSSGAAVLGLGAVSTAEGLTTESVYFGPDADADDGAGRSISVHGAQGVGVELSTPGAADPAAGGWGGGGGSYGFEDFARSWDAGSNRHVMGATPPRGREASPPPAAEAPPQILVGG